MNKDPFWLDMALLSLLTATGIGAILYACRDRPVNNQSSALAQEAAMTKPYPPDTMTDEDLMRKAGAAVGFTFAGLARAHCTYLNEGDESLLLNNKQGGHTVWNPLNDSGQALELAILGGVQVNQPAPFGKWHYATRSGNVYKAIAEDSLAAARRAIVLAMAAG